MLDETKTPVHQVTVSMIGLHNQKEVVVAMIEVVSCISREMESSTQLMAQAMGKQLIAANDITQYVEELEQQAEGLSSSLNKFTTK